jgi:hypothetical protein
MVKFYRVISLIRGVTCLEKSQGGFSSLWGKNHPVLGVGGVTLPHGLVCRVRAGAAPSRHSSCKGRSGYAWWVRIAGDLSG